MQDQNLLARKRMFFQTVIFSTTFFIYTVLCIRTENTYDTLYLMTWPLSAIEHSLKWYNQPEYSYWPCPFRIIWDHGLTHLMRSAASRILCHVTQLKSQISNWFSWAWKWVHFTHMTSKVTRSQSIEHLWYVVEW